MSAIRAGARALVVDDDPVMRLMAERALSELGFEVLEAESGEEAIEMVREEHFDLVLLDLELPGVSGDATCQELRKLDGGKDFAIVMLTGHSDTATIQHAFDMGATDFAKKPPDWPLLQHRLRFLMRAHEAFGELKHSVDDLNHSRELLASAQRLSGIGSWEQSRATGTTQASEELRRLLGLDPQEPVSLETVLERTHPDDRARLEESLRGALDRDESFSLDHRVVARDGNTRIVQHRVEVSSAQVQGTVQDITERKRSEERIRQLAYYDSLTDLPNRRLMQAKLERALDFAKQEGGLGALFFLDLDRFKRINDSFGHSSGDLLLRAVAERLADCVRSTDQVGRPASKRSIALSRLGGDEFTLLLTGIRSAEDAAGVARRVIRAFEKPFDLGKRQVLTSTSIGIALFPDDASDPETLVRNADASMYEAKRAGRNTFRFFNASMNEKAERGFAIENALHTALADDEFSLVYQPLVGSERQALIGVEALIRWNSAELGSVSPGEFIPVAEEAGLAVPIGTWVLQQACAQAVAWKREGVGPVELSVNVSSHELQQASMSERVLATLQKTGLEPEMLELELTETALLANDPAVLVNLKRLRSLGIRLALDDFGTGYSSLSHLVDFPIDTVKIDRSFVGRLGEDHRADSVVAAILGIARRLDLRVVAEGVETEEQQRRLREQGCDLLQGYGVGRPAPLEHISERLREERSG